MLCHNCNAPTPPGATHCHACRIPGDFGSAPTATARIIPTPVHACANCAVDVPDAAAHCPSCRWPQTRLSIDSSQFSMADRLAARRHVA